MIMDQATEDKAHIEAAKIYASRLSRCERLKVCCLFVRDRAIISRGINGMPRGESNCCEDKDGNSKPEVKHAEENAILAAARDGVSLAGATVYITHAPCLSCAVDLVSVGVVRVVYWAVYRCDKGLEYLAKCGVPVEQVGRGVDLGHV